jgi:hypothetical protein
MTNYPRMDIAEKISLGVYPEHNTRSFAFAQDDMVRRVQDDRRNVDDRKKSIYSERRSEPSEESFFEI